MSDFKKPAAIFCCVSSAINVNEPIKSHVKLENRPRNNTASAIFFVIFTFVQVVLSIVCLASAKSPADIYGVQSNLADCPGFTVKAIVTSPSYLAEVIEACLGALFGAITLAIVIALLWLFALQKAAPVIVWVTLVVEVLALVVAGIYFLTLESGFAWFFFVLAAVCTIIIIWKRSSVTRAGQMLQKSAYCIRDNPSLIALGLGLNTVLFMYALLIITGIVSSFFVGEIQCVTATDVYGTTATRPQFVQHGWAGGVQIFLSVTITWTFFFSNMFRSYVCASTTAMWLWHTGDDKVQGMPCKGAKWSATSAMGTIALASLLLSIIDQLVKLSKRAWTNCMCCPNPVWWLFRVFMCWAGDAINALTKFSLIISAITAEDFWTSSARTLNLLSGKFTTLFVIDQASKIVLGSASVVFSILILMFTWSVSTFEGRAEIYPGAEVMTWYNAWADSSGSTVADLLLAMCFILATIFIFYPIAGILVLTMFPVIVAAFMGPFFAFGLFVACIASYIFNYFTGMILDVSSTMFVCTLIDAKHGRSLGEGDYKEGSPNEVRYYFLQEANKEPGLAYAAPVLQAVAMTTIQGNPAAVPMAAPMQAVMATPVADPARESAPAY